VLVAFSSPKFTAIAMSLSFRGLHFSLLLSCCVQRLLASRLSMMAVGSSSFPLVPGMFLIILVLLAVVSRCASTTITSLAPPLPPPTFHLEFRNAPVPRAFLSRYPIPPTLLNDDGDVSPPAVHLHSEFASSQAALAGSTSPGDGQWRRTKAPNGTTYVCYIPGLKDVAAAEADRETSGLTLRGRRKEGKVAPDVVQLVAQEMHDACASKTEQWWTYEACWNTQVRQFHISQHNALGAIDKEYFLGKGPSHALDHGSHREDLFFHEDPTYGPFLSTTFLNGTECDLTGEPRRTEIRLFCADSGPQRAADAFQVSEPQTCQYLVLWWSKRACFPLLRKEVGVDLAIQCFDVDHQLR
jgi:hypothetical protein